MSKMGAPSDWAIHGVAMLALGSDGRIIMIRELADRPSAGKYAGMASIPMGEIRPGETAEQAAKREFGEETGLGVEVLYPIGFFEIQGPGRDRVGVWAFFGRLTGERVARDGGVSEPFTLPERDFLGLNPFDLRPLNNEIYAAYRWQKALLAAGKPMTWIRGIAVSLAPPKARQWLARE
jgi:8-oxo-dGTP pyrophosphatase MutT (NUDIX family)